jgi:hypothetical protein
MAAEIDRTQERIVLGVQGASGIVTLENWKRNGPYIAVNGARVRRSLGGSFSVPASAGGAVSLRLRGGMPGYVRVLSGSDVLVDTGKAPGWMWVLVVLPVLLVLLLQGLLGFGIALGLVFANKAIVTSEALPMTMRVGLPIALFVGAAAVELSILAALLSARG